MEPTEVTFEVTIATIVVLWIVCIMIERAYQKYRPKVLAIIEDSDVDYKMLKMNCEFTNTVPRRYKTAKNLEWEFAKNPPDAAVVDYYLAGKTNGDEVLRLCDKYNIPAILVTSGSQKITGIPSKRILRKSPDQEYFDKITNWVNVKFA